MPIKIGGSSIFAIHSHNFGQSDHCFMPPRLRGAHFRKQSARPGAIVALEVKVSKPHSHFNGVRGGGQRAPKHPPTPPQTPHLFAVGGFFKVSGRLEGGLRSRPPPPL